MFSVCQCLELNFINITKIVETSQNNMEIKVKLNKEQYVNVDGLISSERN